MNKSMGVVMNSENYKIKPRANFVSTCLQGYITASYAELVKVFGEPQSTETSGDEKVNIEWELEVHDYDFNSIKPVTIYNWKDYDGGFEARSNQEYKWHIGGTSIMDTAYIQQFFNEKVVA